ncbi:MAG: DegT/DnrJ/EryC1/StrS family aminotransferase [Candidatus Zixiibacteriota bacterium]|nr:MAG: DegT/DnrJ/EryC1/StrS family aminotransferase [candidate division Zixibacteria bacterium]
MFRLVPPAGAPIPLMDITRSMIARSQYKRRGERLYQKIRNHSKQKYCFFVDSGRTALLLGLKALTRQADAFKNEVVIPAYTCFTVPAAVVRSGLKVHPVDIDPMTMDYDYSRLESTDFSKVLAIVGDNLFGIPSDWERLQSLARDNAVFLVDDAAQAMGLTYGDEPLGSLGDFGFYSLGRGKNLSVYAGGVLVADNERLAQLIGEEYQSLSPNGFLTEIAALGKTVMTSLFLHPPLFWIPAGMPFLRLGETVFDTEFNVARLSPFQVALTETVFDRLEGFNERRRSNSRRLIDIIRSYTGYEIPGATETDHPTYLRLPVLTEGPEIRDRLIRVLRKSGISASSMYPSAIHRIPALKKHLAPAGNKFPGADQVVDRLVTLPTHPYLTEKDMGRIVATLTGA